MSRVNKGQYLKWSLFIYALSLVVILLIITVLFGEQAIFTNLREGLAITGCAAIIVFADRFALKFSTEYTAREQVIFEKINKLKQQLSLEPMAEEEEMK